MDDLIKSTLEQRRRIFATSFESLEHVECLRPITDRIYACPCCGYPNLTFRRLMQTCSLCSWTDDGQDDPFAAEIRGGPNLDYSLAWGRENFRRLGTFYARDEVRRQTAAIERRLLSFKEPIVAEYESFIETHVSGAVDRMTLRMTGIAMHTRLSTHYDELAAERRRLVRQP